MAFKQRKPWRRCNPLLPYLDGAHDSVDFFLEAVVLLLGSFAPLLQLVKAAPISAVTHQHEPHRMEVQLGCRTTGQKRKQPKQASKSERLSNLRYTRYTSWAALKALVKEAESPLPKPSSNVSDSFSETLYLDGNSLLTYFQGPKTCYFWFGYESGHDCMLRILRGFDNKHLKLLALLVWLLVQSFELDRT
jgi:hypothetical protein